MSLAVTRCTPSDAAELAEVTLSGFESRPRTLVVFPSMNRTAAISKATEKYRKAIDGSGPPLHCSDPSQSIHYLKVTDPVTGEIMSYAVWHWLPNGYKEEFDEQAKVGGIPEGAVEEALREFAESTGVLRAKDQKRRGEHWFLSHMVTHPKHGRRGAAGLLVRWPFEQADREGKPCFLDSTEAGHGMYQKQGFVDIEGQVLTQDLDRWDEQKRFGAVSWVGMLREPKSV